ncbi:hypothetical protein EXE48_11710 [Halorubrum sp. ASP1]|uniref:hypothetical protein n=1 Tax=Halorubrum sp. ASP1 TaxID=2518114 RepID=UPI0010F4F13E|nr:hypothetical protein [Halorubrum sp. ASP1]TKX60631.1 hypothetical protein EXE48_11710 [Halorubrum sp. ASP1]
MGQTHATKGSGIDTQEDFAGREAADEKSTDGVTDASSLDEFVPDPEEDNPYADEQGNTPVENAPSEEQLDELFESRSLPEEASNEPQEVEGPAQSDEEPLSASERARTKGVSEWQNESVITPTAEELRNDELDVDGEDGSTVESGTAGMREIADLGPEAQEMLGEVEEGTPADDPEPELEILDEKDIADASSEPTPVVPTPEERGDVPDKPLSELTIETEDGEVKTISDPDGYAAKYSAVDPDETPSPENEQGEPEFFDDDLPSPGRLSASQNDRRPGLDPNPEGSDEFGYTEPATGDAGDPAAGMSTAPDPRQGPQTGNISKAQGAEMSRDAARPTSFDMEYGLSAKARDNPHWRNDDNATATGGIPSAPGDESMGELVDDDHWDLPSTTVSEMQERFMIAEAEPKQQHDELKARHGGELDEEAGVAEVARTRANRHAVSENTPSKRKQDPDEAWDSYEPYTQTQSIAGERVDVAIGGNAPQVPTKEYQYDSARADQLYRSFSEPLQENIDKEVADIASKSNHKTKREVRNEFMKRMELDAGTIHASDIEAVKLKVNDLEQGADTQRVKRETKGAILAEKVATGSSGYTTQYTTSGSIGVGDVSDLVDHYEREGYSGYSNWEESRGTVEGEVTGTVNRSETNDGIDQIVYVSDPDNTGGSEQLKVTIWDSGVDTDERAASNNAERDATGRTIDQTKDIPSNISRGDSVTLHDVKLDKFYTSNGQEVPTAQVDKKAGVDVERSSNQSASSSSESSSAGNQRTARERKRNPSGADMADRIEANALNNSPHSDKPLIPRQSLVDEQGRLDEDTANSIKEYVSNNPGLKDYMTGVTKSMLDLNDD